MKNTRIRISIVIPAYNEQHHLANCLKAISSQTYKPYEVIVVDNNSSDNTRTIAESFAFVTVIDSKKQGVVYARDEGFNIAHGDVIGRIDADTILPADWCKNIAEIFKDGTVDATSGSLHFYDIGLSAAVDNVDLYFRHWITKKMNRHNNAFLLGANMAVRKASWDQVKSHVCHVGDFHEDLDLSIHMSEIGLKVTFDPRLKANISARRIESKLSDFISYMFLSPMTYYKHKSRDHIYMYPLIILVIITYPLLLIMFKSFDARDKKFRLRKIFTQSSGRVNPATYS